MYTTSLLAAPIPTRSPRFFRSLPASTRPSSPSATFSPPLQFDRLHPHRLSQRPQVQVEFLRKYLPERFRLYYPLVRHKIYFPSFFFMVSHCRPHCVCTCDAPPSAPLSYLVASIAMSRNTPNIASTLATMCHFRPPTLPRRHQVPVDFLVRAQPLRTQR